MGVIVQFGGQTPLNLARGLWRRRGCRSSGTSPDAIDRAEDRKRFQEIVEPPEAPPARERHGHGHRARRSGWPSGSAIPSWSGPPTSWAAGRWRSSTTRRASRHFMDRALEVSPGHPILIDKFLEDAIEVDVDAISDGKTTVVGGIMEHIEEAGIHSGDSACVAAADHLLAGAPGDGSRRQTKLIAAGARRRGAHEHPVRDQGRRALRPGGQPARLADGPLRQQGDRRSPGEAGHEGHAREDPRGAGLHEADPAEAHRGQGGGLPLQPLSQRGHPARARR